MFINRVSGIYLLIYKLDKKEFLISF